MTKQTFDVAAYVWPSYTGDEPRSLMFWPEGMGEWQSVKNSVRKCPGHTWPRKPRWGYVNEADPSVMRMEIDAAADHGVNVFIYDWYWFDDRPFLEQCLDNGFLQAPNRDRMKFYLMWANHDANHVWDINQSDANGSTVIWNGAVSRAQFDKVIERLFSKYFHQPNYYCIDGKPVFMFYHLLNLVRGLGGVAQTREALEYFRKRAVEEGFPGLHLQATAWGCNGINATGVDGGQNALSTAEFASLGFDSISHYQFVHFTDMNRSYADILKDVSKEWEGLASNFPVPYIPHVSVGWDNNPRFRGYIPNVCRDNTPAEFERALRMAKEFSLRHPSLPRLITVNSWNEWTETSYLEPDDINGYGYLEAVKHVFIDE